MFSSDTLAHNFGSAALRSAAEQRQLQPVVRRKSLILNVCLTTYRLFSLSIFDLRLGCWPKQRWDSTAGKCHFISHSFSLLLQRRRSCEALGTRN